ncbi:MAG: DNA mismatch repair protein MutS [Bacillota bacterium]|nr:DNA mismatch repair protein MutS [Bacillota bacterium]
MAATVLETLEYPKITAMLAEHTLSGLGRGLAESLAPLAGLRAVETAMLETTEAVAVLERGAQIPLWGLGDMRPLIERVEKDGVLGAAELVRLADCLRGCREFKRYMSAKQDLAPNLGRHAGGIALFPELEEEIYASIDGSRVADSASPRLARVRKEIRIVEDRIKSRLQSYLTAPKYREALQDSIITVRGDHYALPVKASHRHAVDGVVVDTSGSGATVFIEPAAVRRLTNELQVLRGEEEAEEFQVLTALSGLVGAQAMLISANLRIMAHYDLAFAKGRLSLAMGGRSVPVNDVGFIQLLQARHPLLGGDAVPLDLVVGRRYRTVVITGPNTGGKTVVLKTVGLLTLMAQSGLHVPVGEGSMLAMFGQVLADIGDAQSIEQSLSTFSGHISHIAEIMWVAGRSSLVLLDEIGTGTDPAEGAALAMGILEELHAAGAVTLATTHYSDVKRLGDTHAGFINGRMDFDSVSLRPLFRLVMGEAGASQAFWIAERLGIVPGVLDRARRHLALRPEEAAGGGIRTGGGEGGRAGTESGPKPLEAIQPLPKVRAVGAPAEPGGAATGSSDSQTAKDAKRPWKLGDSVLIEPTNQQGVVAVLPDEQGEMVVFARGRRERVNHKRVKLIAPAENLYPEGYDLRTVLYTWQERKNMHDMERKRDQVVAASPGSEMAPKSRIEVDRK